MRRIAWLAALVVLAGCGAATRPAATPAKAAMATASGTVRGAPAPATGSGTAAPRETASRAATPSVAATGTGTATASATTRAAPVQRTTANPSGSGLTPGAWSGAGSETDCGSVLTSDLVAYGTAAGPVTPATGGTLAVYLHNNTTLCHAAGRTLTLPAGGWALDVVPLGATAAVASVALPAPPPRLGPGAQVRLPVRVAAGLPPGWYLAAIRSPGGVPPAASMPTLGSIERFLVTAGPRPAGRVTADAYPAPAVGGLAMPLVSVVWNGRDAAAITVHAALACGPGTTRHASLLGATATAAGPGFTSDLPLTGGGQDPAVAQASWDVTFPGEATSLTLAVRVQVRACGSGVLLGENGVAWKVALPGGPGG